MTQSTKSRSYPVIDADVHQAMDPGQPALIAYLPERWKQHVAKYGVLRGGLVAVPLLAGGWEIVRSLWADPRRRD